MSLDPSALPPEALTFLRDRHLATLTTLRADGSPHVVAIGFTWDDDSRVVRLITSDGTQKVRNAELGRRAAVSQVDGAHWLTLEGKIEVRRTPEDVAEAVRRYAERYRQPRVNPNRVALVIHVDRVLGRV